MTSRIAVWLLVGIVPLAGCRSQLRDAYIIEAFSAEVRVLEDQLYDFDHRLDRIERRLESQAAAPAAAPSRPAPPPPQRRTRPADVPPVDVPDLTPPDIEPGVPATPGMDDGEDELDFDEPSVGVRSTSGRLASTTPSDPTVARLEISPFTRAADLDDVPGIDGVELIVTPFNAAGEIVPPDGELKVVVLDPAAEKRLLIKEMDAGATSARFRMEGTHSGIRITGQFSEPPSQPELHVYVRLTRSDGQRIETDGPLRTQSPNRVAERWTQRTLQTTVPARNHLGTRVAEQPSAGPPAEVYR